MTNRNARASSRPGGRVVFIDQARALAITMMLVGHSLDRFLGEPWRSGEVYGDYQFVRGITSALFLMVSGFSFVVASFGHWDDYVRWSPRLWGRVRRIALILFLGYLLHIWAPTLTQSIAWSSEVKLERFLRFDVLQNIGVGLLLLHLTAIAVRRRERFWIGALVLLGAVLLIAPYTYRPEVDAGLPAWLAPALNRYHYSLFPMVPFTGYLLCGAVFGSFFWTRRRAGDEWKVIAALAVAGVAFLGFEQFLRHGVEGGVFPYGARLPKMPGNTFARAGCAMLAISGLYLLGRAVLVLPRLSLILSKDSLTIYFVHLGLVYGGVSLPGLMRGSARSMTPAEVFTWIAALFAAMTLMALAIGKLREHRPRLLTGVRHFLLVGGLTAFLVWPRLTPARGALAALVGLAFVLLRERRRILEAGGEDPARAVLDFFLRLRRPRLRRPRAAGPAARPS